ncbi:MAG: sigma-70 family RNA polymerase sigma factor [Candidatus Omnitrophica bacterium]|nr:sigma-70 family RNA polymerase sigma factor [Candidatus Omnitrophota bacterium]
MDEDIELIKSFKAEDKTAFDKLVLKYNNKVFNLCYRMLGNYEDANDSAQDTFVKVFSSLNKFRMESAFSTWLYRIAVNTCKNKFASAEYRHREKMVRIDDPEESEEGNHQMEIRDESSAPAAEFERMGCLMKRWQE